MSRDEQLGWEARAGRPAGVAAIAAALLIFGGGVFFQISLRDVDGTDGFLRAIDDQPSDAIASGILQAAGYLLMIPPLLYLYRVVKFRRAELIAAARVLAVVAPLGYAVIVLLRQFALIGVAEDFVGGEAVPGTTADDRAEDAIEDSAITGLGGVQLGLGLALGFAVVLLALNGMRAGLTSRFMGVIGIIVGALYVLPLIGGPQIVQLFWLAALGMLFLGRWPGGRGPAWESGKAEPWPTAADRRAALEQTAQDEPARLEASASAAAGDEAERRSRPQSRKRKRKNRR